MEALPRDSSGIITGSIRIEALPRAFQWKHCLDRSKGIVPRSLLLEHFLEHLTESLPRTF